MNATPITRSQLDKMTQNGRPLKASDRRVMSMMRGTGQGRAAGASRRLVH